MVNKKFWLGVLVFVLVFGMTVVGCENVQLVAFERAEAVSDVIAIYEASSLPDPDTVLVGWNPTKNAISYNIYAQIQRLSGPDTVNETRFLGTSNKNGFTYEIRGKSSLGTSASIRFGVTATDFDENHVASNIVWSEYIIVPDGYFRLFY
jgi:hypothetical protein